MSVPLDDYPSATSSRITIEKMMDMDMDMHVDVDLDRDAEKDGRECACLLCLLRLFLVVERAC